MTRRKIDHPSWAPLYSLQLVRERTVHAKARLTDPEAVIGLARQLLDHEPRECVYCFVLDTQRNVIGVRLVSAGSIDTSVLRPAEVYAAAILLNAASVILVHNHPSGDPTPSPEDRTMTIALAAAGVVLGLPLLDHIILGDPCRTRRGDPLGRYVSFREAGLMPAD